MQPHEFAANHEFALERNEPRHNLIVAMWAGWLRREPARVSMVVLGRAWRMRGARRRVIRSCWVR